MYKEKEYFPISAKNKESLIKNCQGIVKYLDSLIRENQENVTLYDISYTLQYKRTLMENKVIFIADNIKELKDLITRYIENNLTNDDYENIKFNDVNYKKEDFRNKNYKVVDLPMYSFDNKTYKIPNINKVKENQEFEKVKRFSGEEFFIHDHIFNNSRLLPAAEYVEMVRDAASNIDNGYGLQLNEMILGKPISKDECKKGLSIKMKKYKDFWKFNILPLEKDNYVYGTGNIIATNNVVENVKCDINEIKLRCSDIVESEEFYNKLKDIGFDYGKSLRSVKKVYKNNEEAIIFLEKPTNNIEDSSIILNPSIVDGAFQGITQLIDIEDSNDKKYLPYLIKKINIYGKTSSSNVVYIEKVKSSYNNMKKFDIKILDSNGNIVLEVFEYTIRKAANKVNGSLNIKELTIDYLKEAVSGILGYSKEEINETEYLDEYGIDSIGIMNITSKLEKDFEVLPKTLFFEFKTIEELSDYFIKEHKDILVKMFNGDIEEDYVLEKMDITKENTIVKNEIGQRDIAIIGIDGRYPKAETLEEFWNNIMNSKNCIEEIPKDRWDYELYYEHDKTKKGAIYSKWGGFLKDVDKFDPLFFNIAPKDAEIIDPQERLFLQTAYHAVEDAGYTKKQLSKVKTGVFVGVMYGHYELYGAEESLKGNNLALNSSFSSIANRVSYTLNLNGPSMAVDTMCSSSISAMHLACNSIIIGEIDMAIAGGVNLSIHPNKYRLLSHGKFLSSDGKCRSFGEGGDGYVPGEGVGAVLLKSLSKAIEDNDNIYGVIKATSINHGGKTNGYSVPNPLAQEEVIKETIDKANINIETINYIETHGTGTALGDPIEILALNKSIGSMYKEETKCSIGSVKSNIGHLESAAGMAALTKVLLQMKHKKIVPSLHSKELNSKIDFENNKFYVQQSLEDWNNVEIHEDGRTYKAPLCTAISSFGAGGSNGNIILQEYEYKENQIIGNDEEKLIILSAKDEERLKDYALNVLKYLEKEENEEEVYIDSYEYNNHSEIENFVIGFLENKLYINKGEINNEDELWEIGIDRNLLEELKCECFNKYKIQISEESLNGLYTIKDLINELCKVLGTDSKNSIKIKSNANKDNNKLNRISYTLQIGREQFSNRLAIIAKDINDLEVKLRCFLDNKEDKQIFKSTSEETNNNSKEKNPSTIKELYKEKQLEKIAHIWVKGENIDWNILYEESNIRKISLPGYPFAKERYWIPNLKDNKTKILYEKKIAHSEEESVDLEIDNILLKLKEGDISIDDADAVLMEVIK